MKVGDLVNVKQTVGCHIPPRYLERGMGIVLEVAKSKPITFRGMGEINVGDDVTVHLGTGEVEVFCEESVEVVSESRQSC